MAVHDVLPSAEEGLIEEESGSDQSSDGAQGRSPFRRRLALLLGSGLALAAVAAGGLGARRHLAAQQQQQQRGDEPVKHLVGYTATGQMLDFLSSMKEGLETMDKMLEEVNSTYQSSMTQAGSFKKNGFKLIDPETFKALQGPAKWKDLVHKKLAGMNATEKAAFKEKMKKKLHITDWKFLKPKANLTDGNTCPDAEELHAGLCYTKCATLTNGEFPVRVTAFSCCKHDQPCGYPGDMDTTSATKICTGNAVSTAVDSCPHTPGSCLANEEMFGGVCYKSCALITYGIMPRRNGPASCCKSMDKEVYAASSFAFLDLSDCDTDHEAYALGGGMGYGTRDPMQPHRPFVRLAEV